MSVNTYWSGSTYNAFLSASASLDATPFGIYDNDSEFKTDAPKTATWVARRLGYPIVNINNQFPLVFRASPEIYKYITITDGSVIQHKNITGINSKINFKTIKNGFGLIFFKDKTGPQVTVKKVLQQEYSYDNKSTTYNVSGGDKLLLLSHESKIPSKGKVVLDGTTMRGISQDYLVKNVLPNTDPMVRGDELIKFMNLIVKF